MGGAITGNLYQTLFDKLKKGDLTEAGGPSRFLRSAAGPFERGEIKSPEDLQQFAATPIQPRVKQAVAADAPEGMQPGSIAKMDPRDIVADPSRFQFKQDTGGATGTGEELKNVKKYDPELGGVLAVWRDPADGVTYVVNGHHRLELAKRAGAPDVTVRYLDAPNAAAARLKGAVINIAEGRGTAIDAAKVFRENGMTAADLDQLGVSLKGAIARDGANLSRLSPAIFDAAVQGEIPIPRASVIGELLPNPADQQAALELMKRAEERGKPLTNDAFRELISFVESAPKKAAEDNGTMSLFGDQSPQEESSAIEMATLSDYVRKRLQGEKKLFGTVAEAGKAKALEAAGNQLSGDNAQIAQGATRDLALYDKLKSSSGPVNDAIRRGAESLAKKGAPINEIRNFTYTKVRGAIMEALGIKSE